MQTLVFNTKTKTVVLYEGIQQESKILYNFKDVPTVKVNVAHYEVMEKAIIDNLEIKVPVGRFPISNTNMIIQH
jgi:hypothetical protein